MVKDVDELRGIVDAQSDVWVITKIEGHSIVVKTKVIGFKYSYGTSYGMPSEVVDVMVNDCDNVVNLYLDERDAIEDLMMFQSRSDSPSVITHNMLEVYKYKYPELFV